MAQDRKVVNLKNQSIPQRFSLPSALVRLRDVSGQSLKAVMSEFFDQADDALFELADKAGTNQDQTAYFDAMRELRLRRKSMTVSVLQYVSSAFNEIGQFKPKGGSGSLDEVDQDSLSLVDHSQLEQQVAIDNLVNKLRNQNLEAIRLLNVRVAHLVPSITLQDSQMPLSPEVICGGLSEACADLDIDIRAKLVVLKLFDRLLGGILGDFYKNANKTLIAEGVMPDMKRPPVEGRNAKPSSGAGASGPSNQGQSAGPTASQQPHSGTQSGSHQAGGASEVQSTFSELSALLHGGQGDSYAAPGASGGGSAGTLDTGTLMSRLNGIQTQAAQQSEGTIATLSSQLAPLFVNEQGQRVTAGQVDSDVINLVSMLFDFILEDRQLHPTMKAIISRLQIPVLKVALSDKNFFNRGGHPVRKLLNELAMAAMGWTEKKPGQRDPLRDKIESVVERVLYEYDNNVELFTELLNDFGHFMDLDRRRRELVEQRLKDAEEGRAKQERATDAAKSLIEQVRKGKDLPQPIVKLLDEAVIKYLQWVVLREGEDSDRWHRARQLTESLVWSVDPQPVTEDTRSELLKAIPGIVDGLRSALHEISWDPFATDAAIRDLELAHVDVFQRLVTARKAQPESVPEPAKGEESEQAEPAEKAEVQGPTPSVPEKSQPSDVSEKADEKVNAEFETDRAAEDVAKSEPVSATETGTAVSQSAEDEASAKLWLDKADSLRVGSWIELNREDLKSRCKLAAFIKATGKYIFVNRSGAKVAEYQREDLARALERDEISMLDDGLIFDRALESIIDNLRTSRKD
ncbi:DUF1631 domain-containing protein [Marinobacter sp. CHS3-4]|uniref:DUF1631 domain-containing protein n=1 Tax=Marinobacter sp. CHS3-4 TaxID=3045174 RepID=UPI0024B4E49C|nr:DUF1631 domain-containing protein [Marinobacter sp. CHS3-4]MDI9246859.1 DUF1631 domain-containing protein [Marinobacter sp. CHS3-4]